eukprot:m.198777 g.198777  ORF g.198777 m.198777 type:complete len:395 (+) comp20540_c0_seq1:86-1270(+)
MPTGNEDGGCAKCGAPAVKKCSACKRIAYCCVECQRAHWKVHKPHCQGASSAPKRASNAAGSASSNSGAATAGRNAQGGPSQSAGLAGPVAQRPPATASPPPPRATAEDMAVLKVVQEIVNRGQQHGKAGNLTGAEEAFREANAKAIDQFGVESPPALQTADMLLAVLTDLWKQDVKNGCAPNEENPHLDEALELGSALVALKRANFGTDSKPFLGACETLAAIQFDSGHMKGACETYDELLKGCRRVFGMKHPPCLFIALNYALALAHCQRYKRAIALGRENLTLCREVLGPTNTETLKVAFNLTDALGQQGDDAAAASLGSQTFEQCLEALGKDHPLTQMAAQRADAYDDFLSSTDTLSSDKLDAMWSNAHRSDDGILTQVGRLATDSCVIS